MSLNSSLGSHHSTLNYLTASLKETLKTGPEIAESLISGTLIVFPDVYVTVHFVDPTSQEIRDSFYSGPEWDISCKELRWLIQATKESIIKSVPSQPIYVHERSRHLDTDKVKVRSDLAEYGPDANRILYHTLISEDEMVLGVVVVRPWKNYEQFKLNFDDRIVEFSDFLIGVSIALENLYMHQKIESLLVDKQELKLRIKKDEEDLNRRILELTVLYDTSNSLGYSLDYSQIIRMVVDSLSKVLDFDICSVFLLDFIPGGEIYSRINTPISEPFILSVQSNVVSSISPFIKRPVDINQVRITSELGFRSGKATNHTNEPMKSFANVPLVFKEEILGMLNICSISKNAFERNEMTFLHTMANQLASHLGRLKLVKRIERSKMDSVIRSMSDSVIMVDDAGEVEFINPAAEQLLHLEPSKICNRDVLSDRLSVLGLAPIYRQSLRTRKAYVNQEVAHNDCIYLVNATPVFDLDNGRIGTVMVVRDITDIQRSNRIKAQRLEAISQVNVIMKSINDLDNMLTVLMQFILSVVSAEGGSIQLLSGKKMVTKVHSNFPDKIRRDYQLKSGETLSEFVVRNKDVCVVENYQTDPRVIQKDNFKVQIESYICLPIMVKNEVIGVVSIVRKIGGLLPKISQDDIRTLNTIMSLSGTAIKNAILYQAAVKKQGLDQELRIATDIQSKLLPASVPERDQLTFSALSVPARGIGGDFYDFFYLDDGKIGICVADIVGKGVSAGLFMAMLKSLLHSQLQKVYEPAAALTKINQLLYNDPVIDKFVPMFYAILDPESLRLRYSNAGHEPAVWLSDGQINSLDTEGLPLGAVFDSQYGEKEIQLSDGDVLSVFTDGVVDARNAKNVSFGLERTWAVIRKFSGYSSKGITDKIFAHVNRFIKGVTQSDDITVVTLKIDLSHTVVFEAQPLKVKRVRVKSSPKFVKKIRSEVEVIAIEMGFSDEEVFDIKLAINEAHTNVIEHAYSGNETGDILFQFSIYSDRLEVMILDFGQGMAQKSTKGEEHLDELEGSGLGVFLIKTVMDRVRYKRTAKVGTELWLTKYIKPKT